MIQNAARSRLSSCTTGYSAYYREALRDLEASGEGKDRVWLGEQLETIRAAGGRQAAACAYADVFWDLARPTHRRNP